MTVSGSGFLDIMLHLPTFNFCGSTAVSFILLNESCLEYQIGFAVNQPEVHRHSYENPFTALEQADLYNEKDIHCLNRNY